MMRLICIGLLLSCILGEALAFSLSSQLIQRHQKPSLSSPTRHDRSSFVRLAASDDNGGDKRKRRRRKEPPSQTRPDPVETSLPEMEGIDDPIDEDLTDDDLAELANVAKFKFRPKSGDDISMPNVDVLAASSPPSQSVSSDSEPPLATEGAIPLPDIRQVRQKKAMQEELERLAEEEAETRVKIKRGDTKALRDLIEMQPFADADDSYFEEEAYGTVSALLGERTKPFLGIPPGPLQVGHFVGALVIILMAFVQYPGFPLTNLPTPVRDALQGGLGLVYAINVVLAVQSTFKASERGQSKILWAIKTVSVGGLAVDQLSQLPTLAEVERAKAIKGKRAINKKKK